jgi:hypothetical protein
MKPSWKIRRRYIFAAFSLGSLMLLSGSIAVLMNNDSATSDLITGGVAFGNFDYNVILFCGSVGRQIDEGE